LKPDWPYLVWHMACLATNQSANLQMPMTISLFLFCRTLTR
jgi:hypothetical protein